MLSRITLQYLPILIDDVEYLVDLCPTPEILWSAAQEKERVLQSIKWDNIWTYQKFIDWHIHVGILEANYESHMSGLDSQIKGLKKDLYGAAMSAKGNLQDPHLVKSRKALEAPRKRLSFIHNSLVRIKSMSREGLAEDAEEDYVARHTILDTQTKEPVEISALHLDLVKYQVLKTYPSEKELREIARSNSGQGLFSVKRGSIFPKNPNSLQIMFSSYINMYKNIYKNPDCPPEFIINDDDALDGWTLSNKDGQSETDAIPSKVKNRENVFITAETQEEANAIYASNSGNARMMQKARMSELSKKGAVKESEFKKRAQVFK